MFYDDLGGADWANAVAVVLDDVVEDFRPIRVGSRHADAPGRSPCRTALDGETIDDHKRRVYGDRRIPRPGRIHDRFGERVGPAHPGIISRLGSQKGQVIPGVICFADGDRFMVCARANVNDIVRTGGIDGGLNRRVGGCCRTARVHGNDGDTTHFCHGGCQCTCSPNDHNNYRG